MVALGGPTEASKIIENYAETLQRVLGPILPKPADGSQCPYGSPSYRGPHLE